MKGILPEIALTRRKIGFKVPVSTWFRTSLRDYVRAHLQGGSSITKEYFHHAKIERYLTEHESGRRNHEKLIWALLNFELFQKQYRLA
jgi:asparagine synthase (glutamine-hydrolysing)